MFSFNTNLLWLLAAMFAALAVGSVIRLVALRNAPTELAQQRRGSLGVWWLLAILWSLAAAMGTVGATLLIALASILAMHEFLKLIGTWDEIGRVTIAGMLALGAVHFTLIITGKTDAARFFLPVASVVVLGALRATTCSTQGYSRITAGCLWAMMLCVYSLSHILLLTDIDLPTDPPTNAPRQPWVGQPGWFLYLIVITEMNDIMQAIVGRKFGRTKITPTVSPNKSLEGLLGGMATCTLLSIILAPMLTTLTIDHSHGSGALLAAVAGVLISASGFLGDINMSAVKRDAGVKDGSNLLPGMGGVIDRIDSLTFTAPVLYYFAFLAQKFV